MIIGLGSKARQGKDIAGEAIVNYYNNRLAAAEKHFGSVSEDKYPKARVFKFADALYKVCREEYGMKEKDARLLQKIGDGRREEFGLDYWINQLRPELEKFKGVKIITDVRYINEADFIKSLGGYTVQIFRLTEDGTPYITNDRDPNFISEVQLDNYNWDFKLINSHGHIALLGEQAITLAEYLRQL